MDTRTRIEAGTYGWVSKSESGAMYLPAVLTRAIDKATKDNVHVNILWQRPGERKRSMVCAPNEFLPVDSKEAFVSTDDMMTVGNVTRPVMLHNLRQRYFQDRIYTAVGSVLVSVNPYKVIDDLYSPEILDRHITSQDKQLPPHIYDIGRMAYQELLRTQHTQSVVISGESGAGKTEAMKLVLAYLTTISASKHKATTHGDKATAVADSSLERQILASNPVLEAFGNACTPRNGNSSRFGKYTAVHFDRRGRVVGCSITPYLLEKSRIVSSKAGHDRNYHIFGHMLARAQKDAAFAKRLRLEGATTNDFRYLRNENLWPAPSHATPRELKRLSVEISSAVASGEEEVDALMDVCRERFRQEFNGNEWRKWFQNKMVQCRADASIKQPAPISPRTPASPGSLKSHHAHRLTFEALDTLGFSKEEQDAIFMILSAVLHLGNIRFQPCPYDSEGSKVDPRDLHLLSRVASLLSLPEDNKGSREGGTKLTLRRCLTSLLMVGDVKKNYTPNEAARARDALSRQLYANLFDWIMQQVNMHLHFETNHGPTTGTDPVDSVSSIGVLDIFGFERMDENSFEQFCINYCNEKLHKFFIDKVLKDEMQMFTAEGVTVEMDIVDNTDIIALIEGKKRGIITLLDDQVKSKRMNATKNTNHDQACLEVLLSKKVVYQKNRKRLPDKVKAYYSPQSDPIKNGKGPWFTVVHYAGKVRYNIQGFVEKTTDTLRGDLLGLLATPTDDVIRGITAFKKKRAPSSQNSRSRSLRAKDASPPSAASTGARTHLYLSIVRTTSSALHLHPDSVSAAKDTSPPKKLSRRRSVPQNAGAWVNQPSVAKTNTKSTMSTAAGGRRAMARAKATLGSQFRSQLAALTQTLRVTQPHFVRCLKPNNFDQANRFDESLVMEQMFHLGLKALPDIRHAGLGRRVLHAPFLQLIHDITPLLKDAVQAELRAVLQPITSADLEDGAETDKIRQKAGRKVLRLVNKEIGLPIQGQVKFGYTTVFMKDAAHGMLTALGTRGRFMQELSEALQAVASPTGTGLQIFRLRAAIRAAIGVGLHKPGLLIRHLKFRNRHGSEVVSAAEQLVVKHLPLFVTRMQAFIRGAMYRCRRWKNFKKTTSQLTDMMSTARASLLMLEHEPHRRALQRQMQECGSLPYANATHHEYVCVLRKILSQTTELFKTMDTYSAAAQQLADVLSTNPMHATSPPTTADAGTIEPRQLVVLSDQIRLQIDHLSSLNVNPSAPLVLQAQACHDKLAEVLAHLEVLKEAVAIDTLSVSNAVETKDISAAATLLGEHLAKAEASGLDCRFEAVAAMKAAVTTGKARVAHLVTLDEMTSALTVSAADEGEPMSADMLAGLAEPVLEALFGAGELGLGLNVLAVKKAQEKLDSVMVLVAHARVLQDVAQADALRDVSVDAFWDALDDLKEALKQVDVLDMDRRWECVYEGEEALYKAQVLVEKELSLSLAVLGRRLTDVAEAEGAVSVEYLRGHVQRLDEAVARAKQIGLRDEALIDSAVAELESSKLILVHATFLQGCINNSPLKGCGAGTDAEITSAFSTANSAMERAAELGMFGVVAVADDIWTLLVQLEQVDTHIATLRQCIEQIRLASADAASAKEQAAKAGAMVLMFGNDDEVDEGKFCVTNFIEDMVHEAMGNDGNKSAGANSTEHTESLEVNPPAPAGVNARPNQNASRAYNDFGYDYDSDSDDDDESDFEDLLNDVMKGVAASSELPDEAQRHVAKAAAMLDVYADDLLDDGSHPELYRCVEELRSALVRAEELGMAKADLVVVAASTELLQRFPGKSNCDDSKSSALETLDQKHNHIAISEDEVLALGSRNLYAELGERRESDGDLDSELRDDHSAEDGSSNNHVKIPSLKNDLEAETGILSHDDGTLSGGDSDACDSIASNDMPS